MPFDILESAYFHLKYKLLTFDKFFSAFFSAIIVRHNVHFIGW